MTVTTVRDFSVVFDAYMQFEESMLAAKMEQLEEELDQDDADDDEDVRPPPFATSELSGSASTGSSAASRELPQGSIPRPWRGVWRPILSIFPSAVVQPALLPPTSFWRAGSRTPARTHSRTQLKFLVCSQGVDFLLKDDGNDVDLRLVSFLASTLLKSKQAYSKPG